MYKPKINVVFFFKDSMTMGANYKQLTALPNPSYFYFIEKNYFVRHIQIAKFCLDYFVLFVCFILLVLLYYQNLSLLSNV